MRFRALIAAIVLGLMVGLLSVTTASAASMNVAPTSVPVGGTVTVSGDVLVLEGPACVVPGQKTLITLISGAFAGQDVETTADAKGGFSTKATILSGVRPGTYSITGRCALPGGGNLDLGVKATLVVTSPSISPKLPPSPTISPKLPPSPTISPKPPPSPTVALPPRISVPDVRNTSRDQACGTLRDAGLRCLIHEASGGGSPGQVTAQSPAPSTLVDDGALVALEVQGPGQQFALPGWVIPVALGLIVSGGAAVRQYRRRHPPPPARIDVRLRPGSPQVRADETREW